MSGPSVPFHLAIPVHDLDVATQFYQTVFQCSTGRTSDLWVDLNFFGHQITLHLVDNLTQALPTNPVDGDDIPCRHFGVILPWQQWQVLSEKLTKEKRTFLITPHIRFKGQVGEQGTFFLKDPSGNAIEIKSFRDSGRIFAK